MPHSSTRTSPDSDSDHLRPRRSRGKPPSSGRRGRPRASGSDSSAFDALLAEFTARWERGERPRIQDYLDRIRPDRPDDLVTLIYREFCLADAHGLEPNPDEYLSRYPEQAEALTRVFGIHDMLSSSCLRRWDTQGCEPLPVPGAQIGPYHLLRVLGEGGFARVFLAEQADLDDRLVVVKVSSRVTPEARLLARVEHPNIVNVLWHSLVEDGALQILCMPFLGGATLAAILAERKRGGRRPTQGADLLALMDRVSPREYVREVQFRPNRDLIEAISYPRACAWIVARLAEALDFAYAKGVLHGDVKPSNVLLTADGVPMLLDFNLAVGWRPLGHAPGSGDLPDDAGGTLPYMAPERLLAVAESVVAPRPTAADRHRADVYALGVVLLELLTGKTPELSGMNGTSISIQAMASAYFLSRRQGGRVMIRAAGSPVAAGLRAILDRCLCPDPEGRYRRASQLAEDLDLWRRDRPLAHATGESPGDRLLRWARRRRGALAVGLTGLLVTAVVTCAVAWASSHAHRKDASRRYDQITGGKESGAFLIRRMGSGQVIEANGDPSVVAKRHLEHYGVFSLADWRRHDEIGHLPPFEREELEVWLTEQALRFARALRERPHSPQDWRRALICLDRVAGASHAPVEHERRLLRDRLGLPRAAASLESESAPAPWAAAYLAGVAAELEQAKGWEFEARTHYENVLKLRPDSFWGHYRAAATAFALNDPQAAAEHLKACVQARPDNAILRLQLAGCLYASRAFTEAEEQYARAESLDPDDPETYLARTFLRVTLRQPRNFFADYTHFLLLTGRSSPQPDDAPRLDLTGPYPGPDEFRTRAEILASDPDEARIRFHFARAFSDSGQDRLALREAEVALASDPSHLEARYLHGILLQRLGLSGYHRDFEIVSQHPKLEESLRKAKGGLLLYALHVTTSRLIEEGRSTEALQLARRGMDLSRRHNAMPGGSRLNLALAIVSVAGDDPVLRSEALANLIEARRLDPKLVAVQLAEESRLRELWESSERDR
ncbi:MAG: protein kinase [Isosphaeraceae bacterium]